MARLTIELSFRALHGTERPTEDVFDVEASVAGPLVGDFVDGRDDQRLLERIRSELGRLEGRWLDDVVGRATLENIAAYLISALHDVGLETMTVRLGRTSATVGAHEIESGQYAAVCAFKRGISLALRGRLEEACEAFAHAATVSGHEARALNARGRCLRRLGRLQDAICVYEQTIAVDPTFSEAFRNRGNALLEMGRRDEAIADFDRAIALAPLSAVAYNNRGYAYQAAGEMERALRDHARAIELDPDYEEALRDRGNALLALGREDLAQADFARADCVKDRRMQIEIERAKLAGSPWELADGTHRNLAT
jgi:tetratricopeptide (TPR) repeat protein